MPPLGCCSATARRCRSRRRRSTLRSCWRMCREPLRASAQTRLAGTGHRQPRLSPGREEPEAIHHQGGGQVGDGSAAAARSISIKRVKVDVPMKTPGAYLVTAQWTEGTRRASYCGLPTPSIVKKSIESGAYYFVADAVNGRRSPTRRCEFFGYRQQYAAGNRVRDRTQEFPSTTDADGQCSLDSKDRQRQLPWLATATNRRRPIRVSGVQRASGADNYYDAEYNERKGFFITDRPVYRPGQTVKFKLWLATAKYDLEGRRSSPTLAFAVRMQDPRGEKVDGEELPDRQIRRI